MAPDVSRTRFEETDYGILRRNRKVDGTERRVFYMMPNIVRQIIPTPRQLREAGIMALRDTLPGGIVRPGSLQLGQQQQAGSAASASSRNTSAGSAPGAGAAPAPGPKCAGCRAYTVMEIWFRPSRTQLT